MKIQFVLGHELPFPPAKGGGVNSLLDGLTVTLAKAGHEVVAYSPCVENRPDEEVIQGVRHIRLRGAARSPNNLLNFLKGIPYALHVAFKMEKGDVVSCHMLHGFFYTWWRKSKIVTHTIHRDPKLFLKLFSKMDRIYAGTDSIVNEAKVILPEMASLFKVIYNCVDFSYYTSPTPLPSRLEVVFLFVGRFSRDKGLDILIKAFCQAAKKNQKIRLKTLGPMTAEGGADEGLIAEMEDIVQREGLKERVEFCPPVFTRSEIDAAIRDSEVVCLPSVGGETLNMSVIESMRVGRALLISDLPANAPLCKHSETGLFAKCESVQDWEAKILEIAEDRKRMDLMGRNIYAYGYNKFSSGQIAEEYIADFSALSI